MKIYKIITTMPYSDFYHMTIIAKNETEALSIAKKYLQYKDEEIYSIKEEPLISQLVFHDSIKY